MTPTISLFSRALLLPEEHFATLGTLRPATTSDGLPRLRRTTRFAEAEIAFDEGRWLLFLPLGPATVARIERTASNLRRLNTPWLAPYRLLPGELRWHDATGTERTADLVLQRLPDGTDFDAALAAEPCGRLLGALDDLEAALRTLGLRHNNLKAENLRWTADGRFIPLRYHDMTSDGSYEADRTAFEALRTRIREAGTAAPQQVSDIAASYDARPLTGHRWVSHTFEGLVCVEDETGFGFVDEQNRAVIPATFLWAGDFREGRAEVETPTGMGLIDRTGAFVLEPRYEIVDYDAAASIVRVRSEGRWSEFDYLGRQLTPFE